MAISFGDFLPSIIQGFQGLTMLGQGADLAKEGAAYSANAFRVAGSLGITGAQYKADTLRRAGDLALQGAAYEKKVIENAKKINTGGAQYEASTFINAGTSAMAAARFNKSLDELDTTRTLDVVGRQIKSTFATNNAIMSNSGINLASKSYLMTMGDALSRYEGQTLGLRSSAILRQQQIMHEGNLTAVEYLNQANVAIYKGHIANYNFDNDIASSEYQARIAEYSYNNQAVAAEFEGQVEAYRYEAEARNAEYQGELAAYQAESAQASAIGGMVGKIGSLF